MYYFIGTPIGLFLLKEGDEKYGYEGGHLVIDSIGGSSIVNFGGSLVVSPKNVSKSVYGAGSGTTAVFSFTFTKASSTNTDDPPAGDNA